MKKLFEQFDLFKKLRPPERLKSEPPAEKENYEPTPEEEEWLLKKQEGEKIKPCDPKKEARENKKAFEKFKKGRRQKDFLLDK
ncbi:MAG: hypothetical protein AAB564_00945 [Patescibacteria group bacterium]